MPARAPEVTAGRDTDALVTLRAARLIVFGIVLLDSTDVLLAAVQPGGLAVGDVVEDAVGIVAVAALLWTRKRAALSALGVLVLLGLWRQQLVGIELDVLVIGVAVGLAAARRREIPLVLAAGLLAVGLVGYEDGQAAAAVAAAWLTGVGALVGLALRFLVATHRNAAEWAERDAEARARVRTQLVSDLRLVVGTHLSDTESALRSLGPGAEVQELRRVLDVSAADSRAALASLRELLRVLDDVIRHEDDAATTPTEQGSAGQGPWTHRVAQHLRAPHIRVAATATACLLAVRHLVVTASEPLSAVLGATIWVAVGLAVWRPRSGALVAGGAVTLWAVSSGPATATAAWLGLGLLWLVTGRSRSRAVAGAAVVATAASLAGGVLPPGGRALDVVVTVAASTAGGLIGLWLGHYYRAVDAAAQSRRTLAEEAARTQHRERRWVARELHDIVGHELSRVALLALAVEGVEDEAPLLAAIESVGETVASTHRALASLLEALADVGAETVSVGPLVHPRDAVAAMAETLRSAGHPVVAHCDPAADSLDEAVLRTLARMLQEATTNMLRHAPAAAPCEITVRLSGDRLQLKAANPVGPAKLDHSLGHGLLGVEERAAWLGGSARSGTEDSDRTWVLRVELPVRRDVGAAVGAPVTVRPGTRPGGPDG